MVDHPRIRGEHVRVCVPHGSIDGSSPHTRGAPGPHKNSLSKFRIIPAYAGSTGNPKLCPGTFKGSSPHTRGARPARRKPGASPRIIPAYAGSTARCAPSWIARRDHPRIRGEHLKFIPLRASASGSSPHTRGAHTTRHSLTPHTGIIPAYAGSTRRAIAIYTTGRGSSPHTRGAPVLARRHPPHQRIIPAYAGSTSTPTPATLKPRDHPRIRGEHDQCTTPGPDGRGSSPHTRGARRGA